MITLCPELPEIEWTSEDQPDSEHLAKTFLQGERSLAALRNDREIQETLDDFLGAAGEDVLLISTGIDGEIMLRTSDAQKCLVLTGRTADVLTGYLHGETITAQDRMDMTVRSRS